MRTRTLVSLIVVAILAMALPAWAQVDQTTIPDTLTISTDYPRIAVEAGDTAKFDLTVTSPSTEAVGLETIGMPDGWTATFRGGGFDIDGVTAGPEAPSVTLDVEVPLDAAEGTYDFTVRASGDSGTANVGLQVRVAAQAGGEVTLTPDFPGLRTPAGDAVTFSVELRNSTPTDLQFELDASGPTGWDVTATPASEANASTIQVNSGASTNINVKATSPVRADADQYQITVRATSGDIDVDAQMIVEIIGSYSLDLTTADQRLNTDVSANGSSDVQLILTNTGTAPIPNISLTATAPSNWDVAFATPTVAQLAAGESVSVVATVTPSDSAIAGDYVITYKASSDVANSDVDIRTTVNPSAVWGFVGIALIALTLAGLAWVFRRFGRR